MFKVPSISRDAIDNWPISSAGLPTRVVNGTRREGMTAVGELRGKPVEELVSVQSIGRISVRHIQHFFAITDKIERGELVFLSIQEVFDLFLDREEMGVLGRRYGLMRQDRKASRNFMTLQEIGNELDLTRERIRQVEKTARQQLLSRLALHCLQPFYLYVTAFIRSRAYVVTGTDVHDLSGQSWLAGYNPSSILLLLHDLAPAQFTFLNGVFSLLPAEELDQVKDQARAYLEQERKPIGVAALCTMLDLHDERWSASGLGKWLAHCPSLTLATDDRIFDLKHGTEAFLSELLKTSDDPLHFRELTQRFNEHIVTDQKCGSGFVLKILNQSDRFEKTSRGYYRLAEEG